MPWSPSTFRIMTSLFDHDVAPRVCQKKSRTQFPGGTRWDRGARPCRVPALQGAGFPIEALALRATWTSTAGPFRSSARSPGVWLEARLVAEVSYAELMQGRLRAPVFRGFVTRRALTVELAEVQ